MLWFKEQNVYTNLCTLFSINGALTDVKATLAMYPNTGIQAYEPNDPITAINGPKSREHPGRTYRRANTDRDSIHAHNYSNGNIYNHQLSQHIPLWTLEESQCTSGGPMQTGLAHANSAQKALKPGSRNVLLWSNNVKHWPG